VASRASKFKYKAIVCFSFCSTGIVLAALPPDAQKALDQIPGRVLSLDFVLTKAIESSDSFQQIIASVPAAKTAALRGAAAYDWTVTASAGYLKNENESDSPFNPLSVKSFNYEAGLSKTFAQSGTTTGLSLVQGNSSTTFAPGFAVPSNPNDSVQTQLKLDVKQSLLKNAFGSSSRKEVLAAELDSKSQLSKVMQSAEDWTLSMVDLYYTAWLAKAQYESAMKVLARQQKLFTLIQIQSRRGTAVRADVIQVQNALNAAKNRVVETKQSLQETWSYLVINLKLPKHWLNIDAHLIPLALDTPVEPAQKLCMGKEPLKKTVSIQSAEYGAQAAKLRLEAAKNSTLPELNFTLSANYNGVDADSKASTMGEALSGEHPSYFVGLQFRMPLGFSNEKAKLYQETANQMMLSASANQAASEAEFNWVNECSRLRSLNQTLKENLEIAKTQEVRARLEQTRFENGRINLLQVNSSEQDAISSEFNAQNNQIQIRRAAWQVLRVTGVVADRLRQKLNLKE
jgi:outer membrane protein TolC